MLKMTLIWRMIYREKIYSFKYKQLKEVKIAFLSNCLASQVALVVKSLPTSAGDVRDAGLIFGSRRSLEKAWQPTPVFLPGGSYGQWSLVGYGPLGRKESDTAETTSLGCT